MYFGENRWGHLGLGEATPNKSDDSLSAYVAFTEDGGYRKEPRIAGRWRCRFDDQLG